MNNTEIISQNLKEFESILINILKKFTEKEQPLNIDQIEDIIKETVSNLVKIVIGFITTLINKSNYDAEIICPKCGRKMRRVNKNLSLNILTLFGTIVFKRDYFYCRYCHIGNGKGDLALGVNKKHNISKGMIDLLTYVGQLVPFGEGVQLIDKFIGYMDIKTCASTIQEVSEEVGKNLYDKVINESNSFHDEYHKLENEKVQKHNLYVLMDGSHINTIEKNEQGSSWKEMKLGEVFSSKDIIHRKNGDSIITKKDYCTHLGSVNIFKKILLKSVYDSDYLKHEKVVVIGDGAKWIWNLCEEFFPESIQILDYYHLIENVYKYAKFIIPSNEIKRRKWINKVIKCFENGNEEEAIRIVEASKINEDDLPAGVVNLAEYMKNNKNRITYKKFKDEGLYVGSGAIESGNKTVIQQRMKQAGMRWSVNGSQYIAILRAKYKSEKWHEIIEVI